MRTNALIPIANGFDARGLRCARRAPAQKAEARKRLAEQETAAVNVVRRGWRHLLLPQDVHPGSPNAARGFDIEPVVLSNRATDPKPLAQLSWKKCVADGKIASTLGAR